MLGSPTANGITVSVYAADQSGQVTLSYGTAPGSYGLQTPAFALTAGQPLALSLGNLTANTRYYYRLNFQASPGAAISSGPEYRFQTARPPSSTFSFTIQSDSHLDENSTLAYYQQTLANILADAPDFHIDLGDTFMTEKHTQPLDATVSMAPDAATVNLRYAYERGNFSTFSHSVPLFLVNGNHEGELGWLNNGSGQNNAIWAASARKRYFANPTPGAFYSGDAAIDPFVGERAAWYAWTWGSALFVVLDPYWNSTAQASKDAWNITLGAAQYQWLAKTLANSTAPFKFIFLHNLTGGLDGQMRGGIEAAPFYEWGGKNTDGSDGFAARRPGWAQPLHPLLVQNKVTAVFHGHDHVYVKQDLDGIVYQAVPQPSATNFSSGANLAQTYRYASGTVLSSNGHLRVTVSPSSVTSQYVRSWTSANENASRKNGQIDHSWSVPRP